MKIKQLLTFFSKNKFQVHLAALLLMTASPLLMYLGVSIGLDLLVPLGITLMVMANLLALATK